MDLLKLYEEVIHRQTSFFPYLLWQIKEVTIVAPKTGCRILRHIFNIAFKLHVEKLAQAVDEHNKSIHSPSFALFDEMRKLEGFIEDALKIASESEPRLFVIEMLPWVIKVVTFNSEPELDKRWFLSDAISHNWYDTSLRIQVVFVYSLIEALKRVAQVTPDYFCQLATKLSELPYETPQQLLTHVYRALPELYATDALVFLLADKRRLDIGESGQYDSRQLILAIYPYLKNKQQQQLETYILNYDPIYKYWGLDELRWRGLEQYRLLHAIPKQYLSQRGLRRYQEWERKFVDYEILDEPHTILVGFVSSPIEENAAGKMSDRSWLRAMEKYQGTVQHHDFLKGGARELAPILTTQIRSDPDRFYHLFQCVPDDIDDAYAIAFIDGFSESDSPPERFFNAIFRFGVQDGRNIKRPVAWAVKKYMETNDDIPEQIIDLLANWVHSSMNDNELSRVQERNREGAYHSYLNSDRGAALGAIMRILDARGTEDALNKKWQMVEYVASDPSTALRIGVIRELTYMIKHDRKRSWKLFEQLIRGHEILLESQHVREFLYWSLYKNFLVVQPYVVQMVAHPNEEVQKQGAGLACIAAISDKAMESEDAHVAAKTLAETAITGLPAWRRGATHIYTYNMTLGSEIETQRLCQEKVCQLIDDPDEGVREEIDHKFYSIQGEHFFALREFMEEYALASLHPMAHGFAHYLWEHGMLDPSWTLAIVQALLNKDTPLNQRHSGMEELMRLVLRIYMSPLIDEAIREEALNTFDLLMRQYGGIATKILSEWDNR